MTSDESTRGASAYEGGAGVDSGWANDWLGNSSVTSGCSDLGSCRAEASTSAIIATSLAPVVLTSGAKVDVTSPRLTCIGGEAAGFEVPLADSNPFEEPLGITFGGLRMKNCFYKNPLC